MSDRKTALDTEKTTGRNKSADKKRKIYKVNISADSVIMSIYS